VLEDLVKRDLAGPVDLGEPAIQGVVQGERPVADQHQAQDRHEHLGDAADPEARRAVDILVVPRPADPAPAARDVHAGDHGVRARRHQSLRQRIVEGGRRLRIEGRRERIGRRGIRSCVVAPRLHGGIGNGAGIGGRPRVDGTIAGRATRDQRQEDERATNAGQHGGRSPARSRPRKTAASVRGSSLF
jgi:hypothetical protein